MKAIESAWFWSAFALVVASPFEANAEDPLRLVQTIKLPGVDGRIDHFAVDVNSKRLFVAALGNNTVEVVDLANRSVAQTVHGLSEPQGIACLTGEGLVAVASGGDGSCRFFASDTLKPVSSLDYHADADNLRYDLSSQRLFVGHGDGSLGAIDAKTRSKLFDVKLAGHPESFQLERRGSRIFINVPSARQIS